MYARAYTYVRRDDDDEINRLRARERARDRACARACVRSSAACPSSGTHMVAAYHGADFNGLFTNYGNSAVDQVPEQINQVPWVRPARVNVK